MQGSGIGGGGGSYVEILGEELCFVMTMFCSAGKCTVTDNKFCTISEPKNSTFSCVSTS